MTEYKNRVKLNLDNYKYFSIEIGSVEGKNMTEVKIPVVAAKTAAKEAVAAKTETKEVKVAKEPVKETAKAGRKPAAKSTEKKAAKETVKKAAKETETKKAEVKAVVNFQFAGKSYTTEDLVKIAKDVWKYDLGKKVADLKTVELYVKPEENQAYYVINGEVTGSFGI